MLYVWAFIISNAFHDISTLFFFKKNVISHFYLKLVKKGNHEPSMQLYKNKPDVTIRFWVTASGNLSNSHYRSMFQGQNTFNLAKRQEKRTLKRRLSFRSLFVWPWMTKMYISDFSIIDLRLGTMLSPAHAMSRWNFQFHYFSRKWSNP